MAVSREDREAYEQGKADSQRGVVEELLNFAGMILTPHPPPQRTESEQAAYEKGLHGEQLDEDKS